MANTVQLRLTKPTLVSFGWPILTMFWPITHGLPNADMRIEDDAAEGRRRCMPLLR